MSLLRDKEPESDEASEIESELEDFIVFDEEAASDPQRDEINNPTPNSVPEEDEYKDRISNIAHTSSNPNENQTQKVLKAHISVLVSALGGPDYTSTAVPTPYKLGHDALACLKDIKRWIKAVDERTNSCDVALACADSGLVSNDLIVILCQWESQRASERKDSIPSHKARSLEKIMLSSLELLVLLTWPLELTPESSDNQRLSYQNLKRIQVSYKKDILTYNGGQTLKAIIRLILPIMAKKRIDREPRDNAIIRMALFFIRNVLYIEPANPSVSTKSRKEIIQSDALPFNVNRDDISISSVVSAFKRNKVLVFLLTVSSSLGTELDRQMFGTCCLECIYLLTRGVKPESVVHLENSNHTTTDPQQSEEANTKSSTSTDEPSKPGVTTTSGLELQKLLAKESKRKQIQNMSVSTRHGRFGSLLSIQGDEESIVVSGQEALLNTNSTLAKLDSTKKWHSRSTFKYDADEYVSHGTNYLVTQSSMATLREFLNQFLSGGCFNNLIECVSWILTSNGDLSYTDAYERASYFLVVAWFFEYKREREAAATGNVANNSNLEDLDRDYGSVGAGLNETNFVLLLSYFRLSYLSKDWNSLHVAMICLREMLLISLGVFKSKQSTIAGDQDEDEQILNDRELAEGIIHKLFESKSFLDLLIDIPKTAAKHSPDYLNVCVSVVHIILKTFESFASEDIALYVKTKRKQSKKKKEKSKPEQSLDHNTEVMFRDLIDGSDDEELDNQAKIISKERRLDFKDTELRFFHTATVSTYIEYLSRYEDLSDEEIKRCLAYFHRLFVIRKDFTNLYRLDFMNLLHKLRNSLPGTSRVRNDVDEFIYYFMKKFKVALKRFPLAIELLFPRLEEPEYKTYLGSGELYIKPVKKARRPPRLGKDLEFIRNFTLDEKFKIIVTVLMEQEKEEFLKWFMDELERIIKKKLLASTDSEDQTIYLQATEDYKRFLVGNSHVRLLASLVGFELPFLMEENSTLLQSVTTESLSECLELIKRWISSQPVTFEDGMECTYFLRVKESIYEDDGFDDEFNYKDGEYDINDESIAFETAAKEDGEVQNRNELDYLDELENGLTRGVARVKNKQKNQQKKKPPKKGESRRRAPRFNVNSDDEEVKVSKSSEFVHDSDDDSDEEESEFFAREARLRKMLEESGGIVNAAQLEEFKKAWSNLESNGNTISSTVTKAIESTSFITEAKSDATDKREEIVEDEDGDDEEDDDIDDEEGVSDVDHKIDASSQSSLSPGMDFNKQVSSLDNNVSENKADLKRLVDADEDEDGTIISRKKKRILIEEDDE